MYNKKSIVTHLKSIIESKITSSQKAIKLIQESKKTDTKSSAGDKYETGRAMMQQELDKYESQVAQNNFLLAELNKIDLDKTFNEVDFGSLVITNKGVYFISIGLGAVDISDTTYYVISLVSPIGKVLKGKKVNEKIVFNSQSIEIQSII